MMSSHHAPYALSDSWPMTTHDNPPTFDGLQSMLLSQEQDLGPPPQSYHDQSQSKAAFVVCHSVESYETSLL